MRLFEILLVVSCFTLLLSVWFLKKIPQKVAIILCAVSSSILAIHLFFEGYRWQMLFVYIITVLLAITIILRYSKKGAGIKTWNPFKYSLYSLTVISYVLSICLSVYLPVFNLPKPDGTYQVGTETFHLIDTSRDETLTEDKNDKRELMVQIWYPAQNNSSIKSELLFPESKDIFEKYIQAYSKRFNIPEFAFDYWKYIQTNSYKSAELLSSAKPWPVVLISHGMGTGRVLHVSQAENLASHGFVVITLDHTYSTTATVFPDGRVTGLKTSLNIDNIYDISSRVGKIWEEDVEFVLNHIEKLNSGDIESRFKGSIDLKNIGIMGHSFGGSTAFNALNMSDKIKAGINMDGTFFALDDSYNLDKPFMFITTEDYLKKFEIFKKDNVSEKDLMSAKISRESYDKLKPLEENEISIINNVIKDGGIILKIDGTAHYNFTDFQLFSKLFKFAGMTGDIDGKRGALIVNEYVLDFFNKYLKGTGGNLIDGPSTEYPEVKFQ